jgi:hypothetical protein
MRIKFTFILVVLIISFGFTTTSGINTLVNGWKAVSVIETANSKPYRDIEIVLENGSVMYCSFQSKKTMVRSLGERELAVSISSNWNCK